MNEEKITFLILLQTGCFCNPGACQMYLNQSDEEVKKNFESGHVCWDTHDIIDGRPTGAVRVSPTYMTTHEEMEKFFHFIQNFFVVSEEKEEKRNGTTFSQNLKLAKIIFYPIKSCGGVEVNEWSIGENGLLYDREWTLVDDKGSYLNQKKCPALASLSTRMDLEKGMLFVDAPSQPTLSISISQNPTEMRKLSVCGDKCEGFCYGAEVRGWFSKVIGKNVDLIRLSDSHNRQGFRIRHMNRSSKKGSHFKNPPHSQKPEKRDELKSTISFSNESQFLCLSDSSVLDVASKVPSKV